MTIISSFESTPHDVLYVDQQISVRSSDDGSISLAGQLDLTNGDAVASALSGSRAGAVIVDVAELKFVDLYGLRTLAMLADDPLGLPVRLRNVQPSLRRLLGLLSWSSLQIG
ncbi:STAS domain-containing protein [Microbispora sp. ATCC PTA-5024]|uniref:STAS domain-containing protein n=1 Tax=Microbispora sp. ATCC PTA-5024 TaxID=316330 RepID=UPI0003DC0234|nr:STAS domain-containing protein [Microbispora sp. ATCC PTA-5024]ETK34649.1 hypothetical protein MPTA5024_17940 [Microbispora sp. ATCC PTA-5024]